MLTDSADGSGREFVELFGFYDADGCVGFFDVGAGYRSNTGGGYSSEGDQLGIGFGQGCSAGSGTALGCGDYSLSIGKTHVRSRLN